MLSEQLNNEENPQPRANTAEGIVQIQSQNTTPEASHQMVDYALWYAAHGWAVFPLVPCDKEPAIPRWEGGQGFKDATVASEQIRAWWDRWPDANIGTPVPDGFLVVDVDVRHGGTLEQLSEMPTTVRAKTGGGGWHLWTTVPQGAKFTKQFRDLAGQNLPGLEQKSLGGYVVLPPSVHPSGNTYQWEIPPFGNTPIAALPAHLLKRVTAPERQPRPPRDTAVEADPDKAAAYFLPRAKERAADDGRNNTGLWLACQLRDNGLSETDAEVIMLDYQANVETWTDPAYTEEEALSSLRQAYGREPREATSFGTPFDDIGLPEYPGETDTTPDAPKVATPRATTDQAALAGDPKAMEQARKLPEAEAFSDLGDAALLEAQYCRVLKHTPELGWLAYHDGRWDAADGEKTARRYVRRVLGELASQAATEFGTDRGKKLFGHAHQACNRVPYITQAAESFERLSAHQADFDANSWLLGVKNGVVDLRTSVLLPHSPKNMLTHQSPVVYNPDATAPRWERFLHEVFIDDEAQIRFVQKAVGYSLTGDTREQVFFLCHGSGSNGKGVFLNTISHVIGDYAAPLNPEEFMARLNRAETQPNLVAVVGRRLVTSQEPKDGSAGEKAPALDAARLKWLTGGDAIQIRTLNKKPFFYQPIWKLWLAMNRLPDIRDDSDGIWRRLRPIPFLKSFRGREDTTLTTTLRDEAEGILAWCVEGTRLWLTEGLGMVDAVQTDADTYRAREDPLFAFIQSELVRDLGKSVSQQDVLSRYTTWRQGVQDDYDAPYYTPKDFGRALEAHGFQRRKVGGRRLLADYRLKTAEEAVADASGAKGAQNDQNAVTLYSINPIERTAKDPECAPNAPDLPVRRADASRCPTCGTVQAGASAALAQPPAKCQPHRVWADHNGLFHCRCGGQWALDDLPVGSQRFTGFGQDELPNGETWSGREWTPISDDERAAWEREAA